MVNKKPKTVDIDKCPVCDGVHKALALPEPSIYTAVPMEAVLTCPTTGEEFTVNLEEY